MASMGIRRGEISGSQYSLPGKRPRSLTCRPLITSGWAHQPGAAVKFAVLSLQGDERGTQVFVHEHSGSPMPFLTPCTGVLAKALVLFIRERLARPEVFAESRDVVDRHSDMLELFIGHLTREEHMFDFDAGRGRRT